MKDTGDKMFKLHSKYTPMGDQPEAIKKIVENITEWQEVSEKLFENQKNYNTSLFLLLFVIAHINKDENNGVLYDLSEAKTIFKNIIESDLRFIGHKYKGLAKFLYYWGCLYSKYKHLAISYESFYKIASSYDDSSNLLKITNRWDINIPEMERIKFYLQKKEHNLIDERVQLIQFNHDILADVGLSSHSLKSLFFYFANYIWIKIYG